MCDTPVHVFLYLLLAVAAVEHDLWGIVECSQLTAGAGTGGGTRHLQLTPRIRLQIENMHIIVVLEIPVNDKEKDLLLFIFNILFYILDTSSLLHIYISRLKICTSL